MTLKRLTDEQIQAVRDDLIALGVQGSSLLAIPAFDANTDAHQYIRDTFLAFLRSMFRSMPKESQYLWVPDRKKSKIEITYADTRIDENKGSTPRITVELTPYTWGNMTLDHLLAEKPDGTKVYTDLRNGSVIIRIRTSVKLEADSLGHIIAAGVRYMRKDIQRAGRIMNLDAINVNPASTEQNPSNPKGEFFVSNVVCAVNYQEFWERKPTREVRTTVQFNEPEGIPFN